MTRSSPLEDVENLGPASARMLADAGILTLEELRRRGPVMAFLAVRHAGHRPSRNLLWAIHGAIEGVRWNALSNRDKQRLEEELRQAMGD
jgi:DNA transformation protein and related proteins